MYCDSFNSNINSWNTSNVTTMEQMFMYAYGFNQNLSNWDTSSVTNIKNMFFQALSFNQSLGNFNIEQITSLEGTLAYINMSTENWDDTLIGWSSQNVPINMDIFIANTTNGGVPVYYCNAEAERQSLIDNFGWTISDGGLDPNCSPLCEVEIIASATEICAGRKRGFDC